MCYRLFLFAAALLICSRLTAQDLLIHYSFDEESGVAIDSGTGTTANGLFGADATRSPDTPGERGGFSLDLRAEGAKSILSAGDVSKVDTLEAFTLTTWLKLEELNTERGGGSNVRLLAKQGGGPDYNGISWNLNDPVLGGARGTDNFSLGLFIGGEEGFGFARTEEDIYADQWVFLAVTYDSNEPDEDTVFYFGDEVTETYILGDEVPETISVGPVHTSAGEADFGIGFTDAAPDADVSAFGFQDDVRVYHGALTLEQLETVRLENLTGMISVCDDNTQGDLDGNGKVEFADFLTLSANFGMMVDSHEDGDIDCNGKVEFADFLTLSANFGKDVGVAAVPEPASGLPVVIAGFVCMCARRRRYASFEQ